MKRRNFITSTIGSMCILSTSALPTWIYDTEQENWFENFIQKLNAKKQIRSLSIDQTLQDIYQKSFQKWEKIGYKPLNTNYYVFDGKNLAIFPVILNAPSAGLLDISALCFAKTTDDGIWQPITHLTGFHFEGFHLMMQDSEAKMDSKQLANTLLPILTTVPKNSLNGYKTIHGEVNMKILMGVTSPKISIDVIVDNEAIWRKNYDSKNFRNKSVLS